MKSSKNFYRLALMLLILLPSCVVAAWTKQAQPEEPPVTGNNGKEPEKKYALVIGNNKYHQNAGKSKLKNAVNDAESMEYALNILGCEVKIITNATVDVMKDGLECLTKQLSGNKKHYGFFFFSGHADDKGFLLPTNPPVENALNISEVVEELKKAKNKLNIGVLNGCKGNDADIPDGQNNNNLVIYVTNNEARDSTKDEDKHTLFTEHLLKNIMRQELEVYELFTLTKYLVTMSSEGRQVPAPIVSPKGEITRRP